MTGHLSDPNPLPSSPISPAPAVAISGEIQPKVEPFDDWNPNFLPASASTSNQTLIPSPPAPTPAVNAVAPIPISNRPMGPELSSVSRDIVRRTRILYDSIRFAAMYEAARDDAPGIRRRQIPSLRAAALMKESNSWLHQGNKIVGPVPGIHVGDVFNYRMEMCVLGLHGHPQAGIHYLPGLPGSEFSTGYPVATSIIVSTGYPDDKDSGETLVYSGHGGRDKLNKPCPDQKLEGGNLAMKNSMKHGIDVRVTRGVKHNGVKYYVYDGLYRITESWCDDGEGGFSVYKFRLARIPLQEEMGSRRFALAKALMTEAKVVRPSGYLTLDLSMRKERVAVYLYNDVDSDVGPMKFEYISKASFPVFLHQASDGCECIGGCGRDCLCAIKNGGEFPYDNQGSLPRGKPVIFECSAKCKCPPNCRNRVSQRGLRHTLEVFKSRETGWRVRSLELIPVGSFICEYSGVVITTDQARVIGMDGDKFTYPAQFAPKWKEWGNLSRVLPTYVHPSYPSMPPLEYAIYTSEMRNVAFYMGHSVQPNVMVQYVMHDHDNLMFPHIMLFALETIPPMRELTIDYGMPG